MQLEIENRSTILNPDADAITNALKALDGKKSTFAILSADAASFLQTAGSAGEGFTLEYKEGRTGRQYVCPKDLTLKDVIETFQDYARQDEAWRTQHVWEPLELSKRRGHRLRLPSFRSVRIRRPGLFLIAWLISFSTTGIALYCSKRKGARLATWMGIFCFAWALPVSVFLVQSQKTGGYWTNQHSRYISRAKTPIRFWLGQTMTLILVLGFIIVGILLIAGVIPTD